MIRRRELPAGAGGAAPAGKLRQVTPRDVESALRDAWPDAAAYPDDRACYSIAGHVNAWVARANGNKVRAPSDEKAKAVHKQYVEMHKYARAFLRAATAVTADLQSRRLILSRPAGTESMPPEIWQSIAGDEDLRQDITEALAAIETAMGAVAAIAAHDPPDWADREPTRFIGDAVIAAWRETGADVDLSLNDDAPLPRFVAKIMAKAGFSQEPSTASDKLRQRQNRPRVRQADPENPGKSKLVSAKKQEGAKRSGISPLRRR